MPIRNCFLALAAGLLFATTAFGAQQATTVAAPPSADKQDDATMHSGREFSQWFLERKTDQVWARFSPQMQQAMDAATLAAFRDQVDAQLGSEQSIESEQADSVQDMQVYIRIARWSKAPMPIVMQWTIGADGKVEGFFIRPAETPKEPVASIHLDRDTKADLRLPFAGEWHVVWGGRTVEDNYHVVNAGQRFAYDFVRREYGRSHRGDGSALEQYYCWDEPILAPADGRVIAVVDDHPDQAIGTTNAAAPAGNHVMLDLGHGEYALIAHLRQGSVRVEQDAQVAAGDVLGRCGNSGNTSEPHVHFHLQDAPVFGQGAGLPAQFNDYMANDQPVARGEPRRGQNIRAR